jgi:hydrogenase nickel incorporation protein HypA/HybF
VYCPRCQDARVLQSVQSFLCPQCGTPTMDIRQGKELEVFALEVQE